MGTDWTQRGTFAVRRRDIARWCPVEGRPVPVTIYSPESGPPQAPMMVFCHGLGSGREEYGAIGTHVASHGFTAIHPEFDDAFAVVRDRLGLQHLDATTWPADPRAKAAMHDLLFDPAQWSSRARRVSAVIDAIARDPDAGAGHPIGISGSGARVVVAGHSFGAFTSQMLAGVHLADPALEGADFGHPAVVGAALLSPQGSGSRGLHSRSWDGLTVPTMVITATYDLGANGEGLPWRREPYDAAPGADKWLLVAREHNHALGGIASLEDPSDPAVVAGIAGSIAALMAYVDGDPDAGSWLDAGVPGDLFEHENARVAS